MHGKQAPISPALSQQIHIYRLLLSVLVIYIHSFSPLSLDSAIILEECSWYFNIKYTLSQIVSRSAVPGFFFLSAVLLFRKDFDWKRNFRRKLVGLGIPYLFLNLGWILLFLVLQQFPATAGFFGNSENYIAQWSLREWLDAIFGWEGDLVPFLYPTWFLRDLILLNLFAGLLRWLLDRLPLPTLLLCLYLWFFRAEANMSLPDLQGVCFFVFGAWFGRKGLGLEMFNRLWMLPVFLVYLLFVWVDLDHVYRPEYLPVHNMNLMLGSFLLFSLAGLLQHSPLSRPLLRLSAFNFSIYLFHEFTTQTFRKLAEAQLPMSPLSLLLQYFLVPFAVVLFCILLSLFLRRFFPRFYTTLTGGRS